MTAEVLKGAYVDLKDLLAIRHRHTTGGRRAILRRGNQAGIRLSKLRGRGIDFSEVRLYQPGDDIRTIDWRVTARKNKPHTKIFREERERPTLVVVDQTQNMFFGSRVRLKSVAAAEFAAMAAWHGLANNDRVGGLVIGNEDASTHKPLRSVKTVARLLADISQHNQALTRNSRLSSVDHLKESLLRVRRLVRTNYRIFVISDFSVAATAWRDTLHALARHNQITVVRVSDPLEQQLPPADRYTVTDGRARWQFHTGNAELRRHYVNRYDEQEEDLRHMCAIETIRYVSIATDDNLAAQGAWL